MYTFDKLVKNANALEAIMNELIALDTEVHTLEDNQCRDAYVKLDEAKASLMTLWTLTRGKAA